MTAYETASAARHDLARRIYPHKIKKAIKHGLLCLYSDGTCCPPYRCTCGSKTEIHCVTLK
jgi:hypothetical protein